MSEIIFCHRLQKELPALKQPPYPGPLGEKIHAHISEEAGRLGSKTNHAHQ